MSHFKVYMKIFKKNGTYEADFRDITDFVEKIGDISIDTDSSEFQIGVYRNSNVSITLDNKSGIFSDVGEPTSIFKYKRASSIIKITYEIQNDGPWCGTAICGDEFLSEEVEIFKGLVNDDSALEAVKDENVNFSLLGFESLFEQEIVPFSSISIGDNISDIIYASLNQATITNYLTISMSNILPGLDQAVDAVTSLENSSVKDALDTLLFLSNSVLYIQNDTVYVKNRNPSATLEYTFYGQASQVGTENIIDIKNISSGLQRTFNYITWKDAGLAFAVNSSIHLNGKKIQEIDSDLFTDLVKRRNILQAIATEFGQKKHEFDLSTPLDYGTLDLQLLDKINIDYPTITIAWENNPLPICGATICGVGVLPRGLWALTINSARRYKILKKTISTSKQMLTYKLRETA